MCPQGHTAPEPPLGPPGLAHALEEPRTLRKDGRAPAAGAAAAPRALAQIVFAQSVFAQILFAPRLIFLFHSAPRDALGPKLFLGVRGERGWSGMRVSLALRALAVLPLGLCWLPEVSLTSGAALPGTPRRFSEKFF